MQNPGAITVTATRKPGESKGKRGNATSAAPEMCVGAKLYAAAMTASKEKTASNKTRAVHSCSKHLLK